MKEQLRNKIYDMEVTPPREVWNRIIVDLDQSDLGADYANRLREFAVPPPHSAWTKIAAGLEESPASSPSERHFIPWIKYAAAAAVIAALAWGGSMLLGDKTDPRVATNDEPVKTNTQPAPVKTEPTPPVTARVTTSDEEARNDAALEASKKTYAKLNTSKRNKIRNAAGFHFALDNPEPITSPEDLDPATRYIVLMTPDGNYIRMSKKWSELLCCVSGEEQDADCVDQLKKWRNKLAQSSQVGSPGNFGDILDLVKSLQND